LFEIHLDKLFRQGVSVKNIRFHSAKFLMGVDVLSDVNDYSFVD